MRRTPTPTRNADYIVDELRKAGVVSDLIWEKTGDRIDGEHINRYITDGDVAVAELVAQLPAGVSPA